MQDLADLVFSELHCHCPRFTALLLAVSVSLDERGNKVRGEALEWGFRRNIEFDKDGQKHVKAQPMEARDLQYHEPCSGIFSEHTDET